MPEKIQRALSFRTALDQKLNVIIRAFGTATEGAKQVGVALRSFNRWRAGNFPEAGMLQRIDEVYAMAIELLNDPELMKKRAKASKEIKSIAAKLGLSHAAVKALKAEGLY